MNNLIELTDTQVAASLLGIGASFGNEDGEKAYYDETDVLVEDEEEESIDDVDKGKVGDTSNTGCPTDDNETLDAMECEDTGGDDFKFTNTSCGSAPLYTMNDGTKQPVLDAALYRYRGESMTHMSQYEYVTCSSIGEESQ